MTDPRDTRPIPQIVLERFEVVTFHIQRVKEGCWIWDGYATKGYGMMSAMGTMWHVHRVSWTYYVGPIPKRLTIDHTCLNKLCFNPDCLEVVTLKTNILRGNGPAARNARKTHCKRGHLLSGDNLYVFPDGRRQCKACRRMLQAK